MFNRETTHLPAIHVRRSNSPRAVVIAQDNLRKLGGMQPIQDSVIHNAVEQPAIHTARARQSFHLSPILRLSHSDESERGMEFGKLVFRALHHGEAYGVHVGVRLARQRPINQSYLIETCGHGTSASTRQATRCMVRHIAQSLCGIEYPTTGFWTEARPQFLVQRKRNSRSRKPAGASDLSLIDR